MPAEAWAALNPVSSRNGSQLVWNPTMPSAMRLDAASSSQNARVRTASPRVRLRSPAPAAGMPESGSGAPSGHNPTSSGRVRTSSASSSQTVPVAAPSQTHAERQPSASTTAETAEGKMSAPRPTPMVAMPSARPRFATNHLGSTVMSITNPPPSSASPPRTP